MTQISEKISLLIVVFIIGYYAGYQMWCWETLRRMKRVIELMKKKGMDDEDCR